MSPSAAAATWPHCPGRASRRADAGVHSKPQARPLAERPRRPGAGTRRAWERRQQRRGARAGPEGAPARAQGDGAAAGEQAARPGPALKASFLLARSEAAPGDPGGGAARRPRRPVRARPPSAANPTPRSAQRAAGRRAHTSRRGGAAGGAGARPAAPALKGPPAPGAHRACPTAGRGGTGRRGAHARAALRSHGWRPRGGGAALVHVSAPAGARPARGAGAGPPRRTFRRSRAAGRAGPALRRVSGWSGRSLRASWTKCCPRGTKLRARGRARSDAGGPLPLCLLRSRAGGQPAPGATWPVRTRTSSPASRARGLGPPFAADNRPFSQWHRGL